MKSLKNQTETKEIQRVLESTNWDRKLAAIELNISYKALSYKIKQYRISPRGPETRGRAVQHVDSCARRALG